MTTPTMTWLALFTLFLFACGDDDDDNGDGPSGDAVDDTGDSGSPDGTPDTSPDGDDWIPPTTCEELVADFEACGGDIVGTWSLDLWCGSDFPNPLADIEGCEDVDFEATFDQQEGTFVFNADGTGHRTFTMSIDITLDLHDTCLNALGGGEATPEEVCTFMDTEMGEEGTCTYDTSCTCISSEETVDDTDWTWEYGSETGTLLTTDEGDTTADEVEFCQRGDSTMWSAEEEDEEGETFRWYGLASRQ